ncbi:MAG: ASCH domain-containing protein [Verrucomicrobiales bacterium]|nr:ASCH domain-containing protein [Verrucomicrobiales bacterium]
MTNEADPLLMSLKPNYADLVFSGLKTAELRRRIWREEEVRDVFLYVSSPVKELRGGFTVGEVWKGSPEEIWKVVSGFAGVSEGEFNAYFEGRKIAFALEITGVWEYARPLSLESLREKFPKFVVPQSYRYLKKDEASCFRRLTQKTISSERQLIPVGVS